ncbi:Anaphase-promoting complex subunit 6 [Hibiscus syriacus]|uniref:Anaphase-promoting complex subunit 6 n=1 Tax=Hibiscus syriacus TaxID=106335 RepID=A0A6A3B891_HIBSY|nr:Anaphase-promoting complex subunit 6 [Hibiscus syriacus]
MREEEIEKLRGVIRDCVSKHLFPPPFSSQTKSPPLPKTPPIYMQAQALFLGRHFRRAFHLLNASQIVLRDLRFRYLAAKCLEELKEWDQCLLMLGDEKLDEHGDAYDMKDNSAMYLDKDGEDREINISSAIYFLRGKAYEALENRAKARQWYKAAIKADPLCYEALECLIENHMLTCEEETSLLSSLQFGPEDGWLFFYSCLKKNYKENVVEAKFKELGKESSITNFSSPSLMCALKDNTDLLACKAEYYQSGEYQKCFELTSALLEKDPFHLKCTVVHLAAAMELVGCYYYCIKKYDQSRRYFSKATSLDGTFAPAWIGFGNAYAVREEGDQAMSVYRTAARLFPGCHLPTLYIGMEYMRTHSFRLAEQIKFWKLKLTLEMMMSPSFLESAELVQRQFALQIHWYIMSLELLHIIRKSKDNAPYHSWIFELVEACLYNQAVWWFEKTLALIPNPLSEMWEPTVVNLAHAYRKLKMFHEAVTFYEKALTLSTKSLSTYAGLAYTYHLQDKFSDAITYYHKALWLKPDDPFCSEMLNVALADECRQGVDPKIDPY